MAKETSTKIVNEEADYERRFNELEETTKANSDTLAKIAAKLLGEEKTESKAATKTSKNESNIKPSSTKSFKGFMVEIGLFKPENAEG